QGRPTTLNPVPEILNGKATPSLPLMVISTDRPSYILVTARRRVLTPSGSPRDPPTMSEKYALMAGASPSILQTRINSEAPSGIRVMIFSLYVVPRVDTETLTNRVSPECASIEDSQTSRCP